LLSIYTNIEIRLLKYMKILIDEMDDGWDEKLKELGYDAYSVKKLRSDGHKLRLIIL